jgi:hypothetical protein
MDNIQILKNAEQYARENLRECAIELSVYADTAVFENGHVRNIAHMISPMMAHDSLKMAIRIVEWEAIKKVAE